MLEIFTQKAKQLAGTYILCGMDMCANLYNIVQRDIRAQQEQPNRDYVRAKQQRQPTSWPVGTYIVQGICDTYYVFSLGHSVLEQL